MADPSRQASDPRETADRDHSTHGVVRPLPVIPERYAVRKKDGTRFLECDEAPRLRAVIDPEMSVSQSEASALGERVILLDGAGAFGPRIDNDRKLYNLDHHVGCERLFTLSTCEQALLLMQSGLQLTEGDWTIYANDPDLDTVLALWLLLNHRRVRELSEQARDVLLPLLRLEGAIDANGLELAALCGLPADVLQRTGQRIDDLVARERGLKQSGSWTRKHVYAYTLEMLRAVDALIYTREDFGDHTRIEEIYGHVEIEPRRVAVACRDRSGIYTVEQHLKQRWGEQLAIIALENQPGVYTLRRISSVVGPPLEPAYERLNRVDGAVDGRPVGKRWGGSQDIGGSPRPHGTRLSADEVLEALAAAYATPSAWQRASRCAVALAVGLSFLLFWGAAFALAPFARDVVMLPGVREAGEVAFASLLALCVGTVGMRAASQRRIWSFGWRAPAKGGGMWLAPLALAGVVPVFVWSADWIPSGFPELPAVLATGALALVAVEVWFRGLVHGLLAIDFPVQRPSGPWLLSRAAWVSALAYALVAAVLLGPIQLDGLASLQTRGVELLGIAAVAFPAGLALAVIRERSLSLVPGIALQLGGVLLVAALGLALQ